MVKKMDFFLGGDAGNEAPGLWLQETSLPEEDTFNAKKREIIFFLLFIKFSIQSAVFLTVSIVLSFYI